MKTLGLPLIAVLLVAAVLGVQLAAGGGDYVPQQSADPCKPRPIEATQTRFEPLAEQVVVLGLDGAACRLGLTREALVLELAETSTPDARTAAALKAGLGDAVDRLERSGHLPKVSQLLPEALEQTDLPGFVKSLIRAIPDAGVDSLLRTGPLLHRAVNELDVNLLLRNLDDPKQLEPAIRAAILEAGRDEIVARVRP